MAKKETGFRWVSLLLGLAVVTTGCVGGGVTESQKPRDLVEQATTVLDSIEDDDIEAVKDEVAELVDQVDLDADDLLDVDDRSEQADDEEPLPVTPNRWAGTYSWTEFVESDVGSDQTLTHEFTLEAGNSTIIDGTYSASGFQTNVQSTVGARLNKGGDLVIFHKELVSGLQADIQTGDTLVIFQGDPSSPTTVLVEIQNLDPSIRAQGQYFERV